MADNYYFWRHELLVKHCLSSQPRSLTTWVNAIKHRIQHEHLLTLFKGSKS